ncbi:arylalkylamine N-acetyltransferase-like 2 isoform X1 [Watersipora subatra]|uniref:arylalkylamine N-acetyltransferase-like 2 isoform X1 n=1 Tax=Watersipora subatra TaxID=2589382 RepID=UPI00355B494E
MGEIEIQIWYEEKATRWRELLPPWYNFWTNGTLTTGALAGENIEDHKKSLDAIFLDHVLCNDLPLIVAWDPENQKVAGFLFSTVRTAEKNKTAPIHPEDHKKAYLKDIRNFNKHFSDKTLVAKLEAMDYFLNQLSRKGDACQIYGVDRVWVISLLSILPEYTRRGLACRLTQQVLHEAKEKGFPVIIAEVTNYYTEKVFVQKFDFDKVLELPFSEYSNYSQVPERIKKTNINAVLVAKRI